MQGGDLDFEIAAALMIGTRLGLPTDVQTLLMQGDGQTVRPGILRAMISEAIAEHNTKED